MLVYLVSLPLDLMMILLQFGNCVQSKKRLKIPKKLRHMRPNQKLLHKKDHHIEALLTRLHLFKHQSSKKLPLKKKKFQKKLLKKVLLKSKMKTKTLIQMVKPKCFNLIWMFRSMMKIKILIQAQMKMKFVNGPKKTYNSLIMLMNLNQMEKLKCFNHTCKRIFKLKILPTKTLIPDQMKMKFGQQQTYKSLMIKNLNPNQMLNPTLILNQMIAPKRLKMFNLTLPQSQPTLEDGPDGTGTQDTSQTDSLKTLTISSSDL